MIRGETGATRIIWTIASQLMCLLHDPVERAVLYTDLMRCEGTKFEWRNAMHEQKKKKKWFAVTTMTMTMKTTKN
ncbi:hypothetical protein MJO28_011996 [Puccinia striiformis f. sp. tritici]|uniref:Uncharacterized protein n=1 Tax=Puccinia striiformis f. sp. tritici TaxID=168172 RepID=A0ACC0E0L7_9BASI|nr:hypothetical protein MJO28_011996 [Puccinia striiformis f. sp. tritici]KAI7946111.1 hypothetical protein MJO29_012499 [Puccinia striiformis f. sp. tritici]